MNLLQRSRLHLLGLLAIASLMLAACPAAGDSAPAPDAGADTSADADTSEATGEDDAAAPASDDDKTLTILYWQAASLPGPYLSGGTKDQDAGAITMQPLANVNPDGEIVPTLATEIPTIENGGVSEDLTSITWTLKEGVQWSDGSDFTADDVVFTWEYCTEPATGCVSLEGFEGVTNVEAVDDTTVTVTFENPSPYPYVPFVGATMPIISRAQFGDCVGEAAQSCNEQNTMPLGTGPYRIIDFKVNDVVTYERNPNYYGEEPYFDTVIFKGGGDAAAAARAVLETGEADYAWNLQVEPEILTEMESAGMGELVNAFAGSIERIIVNQANPSTDLDDEMRSTWMEDGSNDHPFFVGTVIPQAMNMAIDRTLIAEQLYGFAGRPACNLVNGPPAYVSTANDGCLEQDIEGANALLDEAGIVDSDGDGIREYEGTPLSITYQTSTNSVRQKTQALIKQWWSEIGIETELINHDSGVYFGGDPNSPDTFQKFYADVEMFTSGPSIDPQQFMSRWLCSQMPTKENSWGGSNIPRACNPEYDELFQQLTQTPVGPDREEIVKQMNDIMIQNYYVLPLVHRGGVSAKINGLGGVWSNDWDSEMWNVGEWYRE